MQNQCINDTSNHALPVAQLSHLPHRVHGSQALRAACSNQMIAIEKISISKLKNHPLWLLFSGSRRFAQGPRQQIAR